jgi:FkbM family methyltransferase
MLKKIKKALVARKLFDNWLSLIIKYILSKLGLKVKLKVKINECVLILDPDVFSRIVSRFERGEITSIKCVNGRLLVNNVEVEHLNDLIYKFEVWLKVIGWRYDELCKCWIKDGIKLKRIDPSILYVLGFYGKPEYEFVDVKGKDVVDVGAYVGDSAIYFILRGAKRVIAIEPHPEAYREMFENIKLNNLEDKVLPINAGLASKPGMICVENVDIKRTIEVYHRPGESECYTLVPAVTLADIVNKYRITSESILKMDCEGCEFDVILNDYKHVRMFKELVFEYHLHASSEPLLKLLEILAKDYLCKTFKKHSGNTGIVHCIKIVHQSKILSPGLLS